MVVSKASLIINGFDEDAAFRSFLNFFCIIEEVYRQIQDLALNNPQRLICHKLPTNQPIL